MVDIENTLILINSKDKTVAVSSWSFDKQQSVIWITYNDGMKYPYNSKNVKIFESPELIDITDKLILVNDFPCSGIVKILKFSSYARLYYKTGYKELKEFSSIKLLNSALNDLKTKNCFDYLKQIVNSVGLFTEDGENILLKQYNNIKAVHPDSIMAYYMQGELHNNQTENNKTTVFPFGFNISQKRAVNNALGHKVSIIEGPPGTGKTQTILNIIANAVMQGENVAIVSSNNSASANVFEKLEKYGFDFLVASLGNHENKKKFIEDQVETLPKLSSWKLSSTVFDEKVLQLQNEIIELDKMLSLQNERAILLAEIDTIEKESEHFYAICKETILSTQGMPTFNQKTNANRILEFMSDYHLRMDIKSRISLFFRIKWRFSYGLKSMKFLRVPVNDVSIHCQHLYYETRKSEIAIRISTINTQLNSFNFNERMTDYSELSRTVFKAILAEKYDKSNTRRRYTIDDLWMKTDEFIKDYPIVLSTTYSLTSSLSYHFMFDYVIVDEASQVDIATGALAMSCAKKAVIVGDIKQLPNVITAKARKRTNDIFVKSGLRPAYSYSDNSFLSSITMLFADAPKVLLKEHYRCHPEIIGFFNQRFYNNELIVMTQPKTDKQAMMVYRTPPGNHARGHYNQREIDIILNEVIPEQDLDKNDNSLGIVTPYRMQANKLQKCFMDTNVKTNTADKFQGQERKVMIFSTVDNNIGDFASNPNRLNVAVSRAMDQFIVVTDGNESDKKSPIHDLIGYIQYHNHDVIKSKISSVFDYLYRHSSIARHEVLKKYGRITEVDSENLMYSVIRDVLSMTEFSKYDVVPHVSLQSILRDLSILSQRERSYVSSHLSHVDFLIYSKLSHMPVLAVEVDGFAYHNKSEKQKERDAVKNAVLEENWIPLVRFSTVESNERIRLIQSLKTV